MTTEVRTSTVSALLVAQLRYCIPALVTAWLIAVAAAVGINLLILVLGDGDEIQGGCTHPRNPDTDGDGLTDGYEVANGSDPLDPCDPSADAAACSSRPRSSSGSTAVGGSRRSRPHSSRSRRRIGARTRARSKIAARARR